MPLYDSATLYDSAVVTYDGRNSWDTSPSISIYLAFDGTPYQVTPVWTDVTGYVSQVDTDRSRSDDFSAFVSTATVVFRNETQLFSPFNTSGTYYGKLKPRLQIKIEATVLGNIYPVFRGFCAGFPVSQTDAGYASTVTVQCFDALALLATELVADYVYDYTLSLSPVHYWRCNDSLGSTTITDEVGGRNMSPQSGTGNYTTGVQLSKSLTTPAITFTQYETTTVTAPLASSAPISVSAYIYPTIQSDTLGYQFISIMGRKNDVGAGDKQYINLRRFAAGTYFLALSQGDAANTSSRSTNTADELGITNAPFFLTITFNPTTGALEMYYNGQAQTGTALTNSTFNNSIFPISSVTMRYLGLQEFALFNKTLTAAEALQLYQHNANALTETTAVRFNRLIAMTSFSPSLTTVTTTPVATIAGLPQENASLVQTMQRAVDSEGGFMYVDKAGFICFRDRNYVYTNTTCNTSQATFSTAAIRFEPDVQMELTGDNIRNDITVTFSGGGTTNKTNATSIAAYGTNAMSLDTDLSTIAQAKTLGTYTATVAGNLTSDLSPVRVNTTGSEANWATLLGLEVLDRTTITIAPQTGSSFTKIQLLNSIQHHITPSAWEMTIDGSSQYTAFFILDKSSLNGTDLLQ